MEQAQDRLQLPEAPPLRWGPMSQQQMQSEVEAEAARRVTRENYRAFYI